MRVILIPVAATALIAAGDPGTEEPSRSDQLAGELRALEAVTGPQDGVVLTDELRYRLNSILGDSDCRDRIFEVREATGQLPLQEGEPASPEKPYAIYAVHREQEGCSVMVMMGDPDDVRPLPKAQQGPLRQEVPAALGQ